jgi:hypothetical protein
MENMPVPAQRLLPLIIGILALLAAQPALAKTYKWVDENGVTQYTQTPPPKGDFKGVKDPVKPAISPEEAKRQLQERVDAFEKRRDDSGKARQEAEKKKSEEGKKQADCEKSRKNLATFQENSRIKFTDKDGNVTIMPEEERQKKMQEIQDNIKKLCK